MNFKNIISDEEYSYIDGCTNDIDAPYRPIHYTNENVAFALLNKAKQKLKSDPKACIVVHHDVDFDGIASGYIMRKALIENYNIDPNRVISIINKRRHHGTEQDTIDKINSYSNSVLCIITDSSTNEQEFYKQINTDVIIVDHHDLSITDFNGSTAGGVYTIVNNEIDHIPKHSATEVVYELWYNYNSAVLLSLQLEEWVAISLYSDVIDSNSYNNFWFIKFLYNLRPNCDIRKILVPLGLIDTDGKVERILRSKISFSLVPLVNSCIRLQRGAELLDTIIYRPSAITQFKQCVIKQKELVTALMRFATVRVESGVVIAKLNKQPKIVGNPSIMERMNLMKMIATINSVDYTVLEGFNGLIATQYAEEYNTASLVYDLVTDDNNIPIWRGSVRTQGNFANIDLRTRLAPLPGWTAEGHGDAFGFTFQVSAGDEAKMAADVASTIVGIDLAPKGRQTRFEVDKTFFNDIVNEKDNDVIKAILNIAEINNYKTASSHYIFELTVTDDFVQPQINHISNLITECVWTGLGLLILKLKVYADFEKFIPGNTYEFDFEGTNGYYVLGAITDVTSKKLKKEI